MRLIEMFAHFNKKILDVQSLMNFRPIDLIGSIYKLMANIFTIRLDLVMDSIISPNQPTFLKERLPVDGDVVVNEVVDLVKKTKKDCLILKIDFEKAYDSVS